MSIAVSNRPTPRLRPKGTAGRQHGIIIMSDTIIIIINNSNN